MSSEVTRDGRATKRRWKPTSAYRLTFLTMLRVIVLAMEVITVDMEDSDVVLFKSAIGCDEGPSAGWDPFGCGG